RSPPARLRPAPRRRRRAAARRFPRPRRRYAPLRHALRRGARHRAPGRRLVPRAPRPGAELARGPLVLLADAPGRARARVRPARTPPRRPHRHARTRRGRRVRGRRRVRDGRGRGRVSSPDRVEAAHLVAFRDDLAVWFERARRPMPWREADLDGRRGAYRVCLSEVMLQQTRLDQARPYFERFTAAFPTVEALAAADLDDVLKAWEGLGYYSRARNLHRAAQRIVEDFGGLVPDTEEGIRSLPGVGPYTAAAVLSIAYDAPLAA